MQMLSWYEKHLYYDLMGVTLEFIKIASFERNVLLLLSTFTFIGTHDELIKCNF